MSRGRRHELAYLSYWPVRASVPCMEVPCLAICTDGDTVFTKKWLLQWYTSLHTQRTRATGSPAAQHCGLLRPSEEIETKTWSVLLRDNINIKCPDKRLTGHTDSKAIDRRSYSVPLCKKIVQTAALAVRLVVDVTDSPYKQYEVRNYGPETNPYGRKHINTGI